MIQTPNLRRLWNIVLKWPYKFSGTILSLSVDTKPKITAGVDHNLGVIVSDFICIVLWTDRYRGPFKKGYYLTGIGSRQPAADCLKKLPGERVEY